MPDLRDSMEYNPFGDNASLNHYIFVIQNSKVSRYLFFLGKRDFRKFAMRCGKKWQCKIKKLSPPSWLIYRIRSLPMNLIKHKT